MGGRDACSIRSLGRVRLYGPLRHGDGGVLSQDLLRVVALVRIQAIGRREHRDVYKRQIVLFCGVMAGIAMVGGAFSCSEMLDDLNGGWKQETFAFYEAEINRPRGRGAMLTPTTFEVSLYKDGESVANGQVDARLSVNASDWPCLLYTSRCV